MLSGHLGLTCNASHDIERAFGGQALIASEKLWRPRKQEINRQRRVIQLHIIVPSAVAQ